MNAFALAHFYLASLKICIRNVVLSAAEAVTNGLAQANLAEQACDRAEQLEVDLEAAYVEGDWLREKLHAADVQQDAAAASLKQKNLEVADLKVKLKAKADRIDRHAKHAGEKVNRREKRVEMAEAVASSATLKMRMDAETAALFKVLMQESPAPEQKFLRLLIQNQLASLQNASGRCVWHREVLDWCTDVYRRNPGAYAHMARGGFLHLPHADTCRKRAASAGGLGTGECRALYDALKKRLNGVPPREREMALLFDEINIVGDIAFKVVRGEYQFFGFVDVDGDGGASQLFRKSSSPVEMSREEYLKKHVATHALVFQVAELEGKAEPLRLRQVVAVYGVHSLNGAKLNDLFWQVVENLHVWSKVQVVVSVCDGASPNRLFQKLNTHKMGKGTPNVFQPGQAYCPNPYVPGRKIWFMSDPAHWIKKIVTHWEKSRPSGCRYLVVPDFLVQLVLLAFPPPHGYGRSGSERGRTTGMEWYCRVFSRLYQLLGGSRETFYRSHTPHSSARCPRTPPRLAEMKAILAIVRAWHAHNAQLPGLTPKERSARGFSHQLFWDTQIMVEGFLGLLAELEQVHGSYIVRARMLNQDSLESLFGRVRFACGGGKDPSLLKVAQAIPRVEATALATAGLRETDGRSGAARTNSGQVHQAFAWAEPQWLHRLRIVIPDDQAFAAMCQAARTTAVPGHEVLWQVLSELQRKDETRPLGGGKLMHWLTTATHIQKTGFSRMRVGLAMAVLCGGANMGCMMADVLQFMRYSDFPGAR